jgi:serine/threonine-protein kinase
MRPTESVPPPLTGQVIGVEKSGPAAGPDAPTLAGDPTPTTGAARTPPSLEREVQQVLHRRLRVCCWLSGVLFLVLFVCAATGRALLSREVIGAAGLALCGVSTAAFLAGAAALSRRTPWPLPVLRGLELVLFGLATLFSAYWQWKVLSGPAPGDLGPGGLRYYTLAGTISSNLVWFAGIVSYGVFIPNRPRRCLAVTLGLAALGLAIPLAAALAGGRTRPEWPTHLAMTAATLALAVGVAAFGSFKISALQREAHAARREARELGQYRLKGRLGAGGMGEVYLAEHRLLKRPCAIKLIRPERAGDPQFLGRFEREVRATALLDHPGVVAVYDYGHAADGTFYYVMEYLPGVALDRLVDRHGPLPPALVAHLLRQLGAALRAAHGRGLVHRDLKPSNVIVRPGCRPHDRAKLLDFGLVRDAAADSDVKLTRVGTVVGTPDFMAPEQAEGAAPVDARGDLYGLGAVAYFLLTGRPPFERDTAMQTMLAHLRDPVTPPSALAPGTPADLEAVVLRCLAKKPDERYPDADAMGKALAACACAGEWTEEAAAAWWRLRLPQGASTSAQARGTQPTSLPESSN